MLNMFRRPTDPKEFNHLYLGSGMAMLASMIVAHSMGVPNIHLMGYLASSICCIGAICGLSAMPTARIGKYINLIIYIVIFIFIVF